MKCLIIMCVFVGTCKRSVHESNVYLPPAGLCACVCSMGLCFCFVPLLNRRLVIDQVVCVLVLRRQHIISETVEQLVYSAVTNHSDGSPNGFLCFVLAHTDKKIKTVCVCDVAYL